MKRLSALALVLTCGVCAAWSSNLPVRHDDDDAVQPRTHESTPANESTSNNWDSNQNTNQNITQDNSWQNENNQNTTQTNTTQPTNWPQHNPHAPVANTAKENWENLDPAMQAWCKANMPKGEHAELFGNMLGEWKTQTTWRVDPSAPAQQTTGTCSNTAVFQRFVKQEFTGELIPGMKFQGSALFGFNNASGQYECCWVDNTSTAMTVNTGTKQDDGSILWTGTCNDPSTGLQKTTKATTSWKGKDTMTYTMWDTASDGSEFAALEVVYTKVTNTQARAEQSQQRQQQIKDAKRAMWRDVQRQSNAEDR